MKRISPHSFERELARIVESIKPYGPQKVILYGSFARGDYHALSDVDLLIVKDTERPFVQRIGDVLGSIDSSLCVEPLVYTRAELAQMEATQNRFVMQALAEGRVVYEQFDEQ